MNLITVHDGFTLRDLVSYNDKHNEANGESNRDGTSDNRSWNCGAEGPTDDSAILALRERQSRAMLTTLLLSFGVPMLLGGDELGRTQQGNNNAYCQDNEIAWVDWSQPDTELQDFTRALVAFRKQHPVFRRRRFLAGAEAAELCWYTPSGSAMTAGDWSDPKCPGYRVLPGRVGRAGPGGRRHAAARRRLPGPGERLVGTARVHPPGHQGAGRLARRDRHLRRDGTRQSGQTGGRW